MLSTARIAAIPKDSFFIGRPFVMTCPGQQTIVRPLVLKRHTHNFNKGKVVSGRRSFEQLSRGKRRSPVVVAHNKAVLQLLNWPRW
jgi:hypothetical protein